MKRVPWITVILLVALAPCVRADNVVYFNLTSIDLEVSPNYGGDNVFFYLSGPGTYITGDSGINCLNQWCSAFTAYSPGSTVFTNIGQIYIDNFNDAMVGGQNYSPGEIGFSSGFSVAVLGNIVLPSHPTGSFTECVPASLPGPITGIAGSGQDFIQFSLNTPNGGKFCTTWDFLSGQYLFDRGQFTVPGVPEPGTLGLMASGLVALLGTLHRRIKSR